MPPSRDGPAAGLWFGRRRYVFLQWGRLANDKIAVDVRRHVALSVLAYGNFRPVADVHTGERRIYQSRFFFRVSKDKPAAAKPLNKPTNSARPQSNW